MFDMSPYRPAHVSSPHNGGSDGAHGESGSGQAAGEIHRGSASGSSVEARGPQQGPSQGGSSPHGSSLSPTDGSGRMATAPSTASIVPSMQTVGGGHSQQDLRAMYARREALLFVEGRRWAEVAQDGDSGCVKNKIKRAGFCCVIFVGLFVVMGLLFHRHVDILL